MKMGCPTSGWSTPVCTCAQAERLRFASPANLERLQSVGAGR